MTIEERDLPLLIALQEDPLATASKLAKAVDLSVPTVITRLDVLKSDNAYYYVSADPNLAALGMEIIDVLLQIDDVENVQYLENSICYNHPFTLFRIRCFGNFNGLYIQFRIPKGTLNYIEDLLLHLQKKKRIQGYHFLKGSKTALTIFNKANLSNWEHKLMRWNFNWDNWIKKIDSIESKLITKQQEQPLLTKLDELDIALLQELTKNARRKNTEIMETQKLDKSITGLPQKISRKLKTLDKNFITQYRVFLRWEAFEIFNSFLGVCECDSKTSFKFQNLLLKHPIPFESTFKILENGFLLYIRCPASHFSHIAEILWRLSKKVNFYYLDYKNTFFYVLWKGAFDINKHQWSIDMMKKEKIL